MKTCIRAVAALCMVAAIVLGADAQPKRLDAIWARTAPVGSITLDGKMNEAAWAKADSVVIQFGKDPGIPGSGYQVESGGWSPSDPMHATVKFLIVDSALYVGFQVKDSSIGGGLFSRADGIVSNLRDKSNGSRPSPPGEYLWGWIVEPFMKVAGDDSPGGAPGYGPAAGAGGQPGYYETAATVQGLSNSDAVKDTGYTVEMKYNLKSVGYNVTRSAGDILMYSFSIRDCDWNWPSTPKVTFNRTWLQSPWGNVSWYDHIRVHARPDVTISSGATPTIMPEVTIPNGKNFAVPVIDGKLNDPIWKAIKGFDIRYNDSLLRETYPSTGPYRSGQYQPQINKLQSAVLDPADATAKFFFNGDTLYVGIDVRDKFVQYHPEFDRWDAIMLTLNDRVVRGADSNLAVRQLTVQVGPDGKPILQDFLPTLASDSAKGARVALTLKGGTTVDTLGEQLDSGYVVEMAIDLTKLGYPAGRGDGALFVGLDILDGDSFGGPASGLSWKDDYGTRVWWFRENAGGDGPAFAYMDPSVVVSVGDVVSGSAPTEFQLLGNYPNPFNPATTIKFTTPEAGSVVLHVYDVLGRSISSYAIGDRSAGTQMYKFDASSLSSGVYFYQLRMNGHGGKEFATSFSKMTLLK